MTRAGGGDLMTTTNRTPALAFFGDDFTGSSENLAQACRAGLSGRLYFETADLALVADAGRRYDVVGIAGTTRAQSPEEMAAHLPAALAALARTDAALLQYKICSTFDSGPRVGNFMTVVKLARDVWTDMLVPVFPATPSFGRYTAFSNHFSRHQGALLRLDRNPALVDHPSTPMREADLRRHLEALGASSTAAIHLTELASAGGIAELLATRGAGGVPVVVDTVTDDDLDRVSSAVWQLAKQGQTVFALAAQGFAAGIGRAAVAERTESSPAARDIVAPVDRMLVLSGSCSVQTGRQLAAAEQAGWTMIELPAGEVPTRAAALAAAEAIGPVIEGALQSGRSVAAFTARGAATLPPDGARTRALGILMAEIFRRAVERCGLTRACFAGGDSSSYAMTATGADAMDLAKFDTRQGCHVFRLASRDRLDGVEVLLKGGQVGDDSFFLAARAGG